MKTEPSPGFSKPSSGFFLLEAFGTENKKKKINLKTT